MRWIAGIVLWLIIVYGYMRLFGMKIHEDEDLTELSQAKFEKWKEEFYK